MINYFPKDALERLEFNQIQDRLKNFAIGDLAKAAIQDLMPFHNFTDIHNAFKVIQAYGDYVELNEVWIQSEYVDILPFLDHLHIEGYVLELQEVIEIFRYLKIAENIQKQRSLVLEEEGFLPLLPLIDEVADFKALTLLFDRIFNEKFEIKKNATPELEKILHRIHGLEKNIDKIFQQEVRKFSKLGYLTETQESIRNGRRVLSVKSEHKRSVRGVIHDESGTGKATYIEPEAVLDLYHEWTIAQQDKKKEIYKILLELSSNIALQSSDLELLQQQVIYLDVMQAKVRYANQIGGICPIVKPQTQISIVEGRHPILLEHFLEEDKEVVPFNMQLLNDNRIIVLSGPNAGGKSVLLKSLGILQLMVQAAIPVPVNERSKFGVFKQFFVDIGDQQSIEDDLSTYSSHLRNMRWFLSEADADTLILFDEFGGGTDPRLGGAIAESVLHYLNKKHVFGLITTHYNNLKSYASKQKGIVNAAMNFDKKHLSPTYEFSIGRAGSSFAFEIAKKNDLPKAVLMAAKKNAGNAVVNVDKMLAEIQRDKIKLQEQEQALAQKEKQLQTMVKSYEAMIKDLEAQRKKLRILRKEQEVLKTAELNRRLEKAIQEIKTEKNLEQAKRMKKKVEQELKIESAALNQLEEQEWKEIQKESEKPIQVGDFVKLRKSGTEGKVTQISKGKAYIDTGVFSLEAKIRDLVHINTPIKVNKQKSIKTDLKQDQNRAVNPKLDIRGLPHSEADKLLDAYLDRAIINNLHKIEIVHGKGSGVLRKLVKSKARNLNVFDRIYHPEPDQGGEGVTFLEM